MLIRDEYGIIVQHPSMDGGDSAARMGISALASEEDHEKLWDFIKGSELVRHPYQSEWVDPRKTSRDQLVQFCVERNYCPAAEKYAKKWFINKDFLSPAVRLFLYKVYRDEKPPSWLEKLGLAEMYASMIWNTKIKPNDELNQFACLCIRFGPYWCKRLLSEHPNLEQTIMSYWSGWRDQKEIGEILFNKIKEVANAS